MKNLIVVLRYTSHDEITAELTSFGLVKEAATIGHTQTPFYRWGFLQTSDKVDQKTGEIFTTAQVPAELVDSIMSLNPTSFALVWRSDENAEDPWPTYAIEDVDDDNAGLGTYHQQGVGGLA